VIRGVLGAAHELLNRCCMTQRLAVALTAAALSMMVACGSAKAPAPGSDGDFACRSEAGCSATAPVCALIDSPNGSGAQSLEWCSSVGDDDTQYICVTGTSSLCVSALLASRTCTADADCPDPGAFCAGPDEGFGSGICSRPCDLMDAAGNCGPAAACAVDSVVTGGHACLTSCAQAGWCPDGFACDPAYDLTAGRDAQPPRGRAFGTKPSQWLCVPYCTADAQCTGAPCDPYTHRCGPVDYELQDDGAPCAVPTDCRSGQCETAGFLDGDCDSTCVQPDQGAYDSPTLPNADCPGDEVCAPDPAGGPNVLSRCFPRCSTDADCRADYICVHPQRPGPGPRTVDGFCDALSDPLSTE